MFWKWDRLFPLVEPGPIGLLVFKIRVNTLNCFDRKKLEQESQMFTLHCRISCRNRSKLGRNLSNLSENLSRAIPFNLAWKLKMSRKNNKYRQKPFKFCVTYLRRFNRWSERLNQLNQMFGQSVLFKNIDAMWCSFVV